MLHLAGLNKVNSFLNDNNKVDSQIIFSIIFIETTITVGGPKKPTAFHKEPHCP